MEPMRGLVRLGAIPVKKRANAVEIDGLGAGGAPAGALGVCGGGGVVGTVGPLPPPPPPPLGSGVVVRLGIGRQSVCTHAPASAQSNLSHPPFAPDIHAHPMNCPLALIVTPAPVGAKLTHEPTFAYAKPESAPVFGFTLTPAPVGLMLIQPISSPHALPVMPVSVIEIAVAPGVLPLIVGAKFTCPKVVHAASLHTFAILLTASIVPIDMEARAMFTLARKSSDTKLVLRIRALFMSSLRRHYGIRGRRSGVGRWRYRIGCWDRISDGCWCRCWCGGRDVCVL